MLTSYRDIGGLTNLIDWKNREQIEICQKLGDWCISHSYYCTTEVLKLETLHRKGNIAAKGVRRLKLLSRALKFRHLNTKPVIQEIIPGILHRFLPLDHLFSDLKKSKQFPPNILKLLHHRVPCWHSQSFLPKQVVPVGTIQTSTKIKSQKPIKRTEIWHKCGRKKKKNLLPHSSCRLCQASCPNTDQNRWQSQNAATSVE